MLDYSLTYFISKYENTLDYSDLIKYGVKIFKPEDVNKQYKYEEIFKFYYTVFKLKNKVRSGWDSKHWNVIQIESKEYPNML